MARYVSAKEATVLLGVKPATLYAYVSRGLVHSDAGDGKTRRYLLEDIERLTGRNELRRDPAKAVKDALDWGAPVLESAITLIDNGKLYYRGYDAGELARYRRFADVAELLWTDELPAGQITAVPYTRAITKQTTIQTLQTVLIEASMADLAAYNFERAAVIATGRRILSLAMSNLPGGGGSADIVNAALILSADHELNASSFAARVAASAGSNPYQAVIAGLATIQGVRHGGDTEHTSAMLREAGDPEQVRDIIGQRLRRGERIPGFGHKLYPDGDPRALALLEMLRERYRESPALAISERFARETTDIVGRHPNVDFALATAERVCDLHRGSALMIFAVGRIAGWIAHVLEQYESEKLIRPRARYTGPMPR